MLSVNQGHQSNFSRPLQVSLTTFWGSGGEGISIPDHPQTGFLFERSRSFKTGEISLAKTFSLTLIAKYFPTPNSYIFLALLLALGGEERVLLALGNAVATSKRVCSLVMWK